MYVETIHFYCVTFFTLIAFVTFVVFVPPRTSNRYWYYEDTENDKNAGNTKQAPLDTRKARIQLINAYVCV